MKYLKSLLLLSSNFELFLQTSADDQMLWRAPQLFPRLPIRNFHGSKIKTAKIGQASGSLGEESAENDFAGRRIYQKSRKNFERKRILHSGTTHYSAQGYEPFFKTWEEFHFIENYQLQPFR